MQENLEVKGRLLTIQRQYRKGEYQNPDALQQAMPEEMPPTGSPVVLEYKRHSFWIAHEIVLVGCIVLMIFSLGIFLISRPNQYLGDAIGLVILASATLPFAFNLDWTDQHNYIVLNNKGMLWRKGVRTWLLVEWKEVTEIALNLIVSKKLVTLTDFESRRSDMATIFAEIGHPKLWRIKFFTKITNIGYFFLDRLKPLNPSGPDLPEFQLASLIEAFWKENCPTKI